MPERSESAGDSDARSGHRGTAGSRENTKTVTSDIEDFCKLCSGCDISMVDNGEYKSYRRQGSPIFYASGNRGIFHLLRKGGAKTMKKNEIVLFETADNEVSLQVQMQDETVWLTANQMAQLFERDEKTLRKHINNVFSEGEVDRDSNTQKMRVAGVSQPVAFYNLDVIISVGYRVKSQRGVEFRRWANSVLKDYILRGYAVNDKRINQLGQIVQIMKRAENQLDAQQVLSVVESYSAALDLLDG